MGITEHTRLGGRLPQRREFISAILRKLCTVKDNSLALEYLLTTYKHSGLSDIYTQQGLLRLRLTGVKLMWTTVGFAPVENQVLVMIILPLLAITDVEERIVGGKERSLDTEPARVLKPASTPLQQSPSTMPVEKLAEPRLAAIYHSPGPRFERRFEPFDLEPGDVLAVHGKEGVIVRTGTFGSMLFEYQSETRVEIVENQGREKAASSVA